MEGGDSVKKTQTITFLKAFMALYTGLLLLSLRFVEPEFRPWERLHDESTYRFFTNRSITTTAIGDLSRETSIRALQVEKQVTFTTDEWGLRNTNAVLHPEIVVLGDSYLAGSGTTDADTLTAKMSSMLGTSVYNFGVQSIDVPALFLRDPRFSEIPPEILIWAPVARRIRPRPLSIPVKTDEPPSLAQRLIATHREVGEALALYKERMNRDNQLSFQARYLYNGLLYRLMGHENLIYPEGPEGSPALALDVEAQGLHVSPLERGVREVVSMVRAFSQFLDEHRVRFVYCPIPESATIYPELFQDRKRIVTPSFLDILISELEEAGVVTVDLRPVFAAHKSPYLYYRDDSHWNPRAIELAAGALSQRVSEWRHESARHRTDAPDL